MCSKACKHEVSQKPLGQSWGSPKPRSLHVAPPSLHVGSPSFPARRFPFIMHLWSSDYIGGDNDGYDISKRGFFPGLSAVRPKPAGTSNDGWEISTSENADWGAPTSSKVRSSTTASKVASSTSSMAPRGVVPALVSGPVFAVPTPFKGEEHQVDEGALTASLTFLKAGGVQNIIACGASGEFSSLTVMERQRVTAVCASVFPTATFANISAASCEDAVALEQQAQWVGCISTLLSAPLDSNNTSEQGVEAFLGEVLALPLGVLVWHGLAFAPPTAATAAAFSRRPR